MKIDLQLCLKYPQNWLFRTQVLNAAFLGFLMGMEDQNVLIISEITCISISFQTSIFLTNLEKQFCKASKNANQILPTLPKTKNPLFKQAHAPVPP